MSKRLRGKACIYCGRQAGTDDHVPPKGLFPKDLRKGLTKVPSCLACNYGFSKDDEYFRTMLTMGEVLEKNQAAQAVLQDVYRALDNPNKQGFADAIRKSMKIVPRMSPTGLFVDMAPTYNIDVTRMRGVAARIARGLYYHEKGTVLPVAAVALAAWAPEFAIHPGQQGQLLRRLSSYVRGCRFRCVVPNVFSYWLSLMDEFDRDDECMSVWWLEFYDKLSFLCLTWEKPPQVVDDGAARETTVPGVATGAPESGIGGQLAHGLR